jgi:hypothetical protein
MKSTIVQLDNRIDVKVDTAQGILKYDIDNAYPQRMRLIAYGSATTKACIDTFSKYIRGEGFAEPVFYGSTINRKGWTFDRLLRKISDDYALYKGFAIHINYNLEFKIVELNYVPFEYVRLSEPDDVGYSAFAITYDDWGRKKRRTIDEKFKHTIHIYNPSPSAISAQIQDAGGIENYSGQIFYYTGDADDYPLSSIDSIIEDCETDGELKYFKNRVVTTNFMASHLYVHKGRFDDNRDREDFVQNLKTFQGSRNAASLMLIECEQEEAKPELIKVENNINDSVFEYTEQSVRKNIITAFNIPSILLGMPTAGALGEKNEREQAKNMYSDIVKDERILMEAVFAELFDNWYAPEQNPTKNFSIIPITASATTIKDTPELLRDMTINERREILLNLPPQEEKTAATKLLVETLGVGGTQALQQIVIDPTLSKEQKIAMLKLVFGFTDEDARAIITPQTNDGQTANI